MAADEADSSRFVSVAIEFGAMLVLHDDPVREYAYGPASGLPDTKVGTFTQALYDEAKSRGWNVIQHEE